MTRATSVIKKEHRNLASVLNCLRNMVSDIEQNGSEPDFTLIDSILDYVELFLNTFHHPKEDRYLLTTLREQVPGMAGTLDALEVQHERHAPLLKDLRARTEDYRKSGPQAFVPFKKAVEAYLQAEWDHMRLEENEILPAAERSLSAEDWQEIDAAFRANEDPVFGERPTAVFEALWNKITSNTPAPYRRAAGD